MEELEDYNWFGPLYQINTGLLLKKVLEVKDTEIERAGLKLFACTDFLTMDIMSIYIGSIFYPSIEIFYSINNFLFVSSLIVIHIDKNH